MSDGINEKRDDDDDDDDDDADDDDDDVDDVLSDGEVSGSLCILGCHWRKYKL